MKPQYKCETCWDKGYVIDQWKSSNSVTLKECPVCHGHPGESPGLKRKNKKGVKK